MKQQYHVRQCVFVHLVAVQNWWTQGLSVSFMLKLKLKLLRPPVWSPASAPTCMSLFLFAIIMEDATPFQHRALRLQVFKSIYRLLVSVKPELRGTKQLATMSKRLESQLYAEALGDMTEFVDESTLPQRLQNVAYRFLLI